MEYPRGLPPGWEYVWEYTFGRRSGADRRKAIMYILNNGLIDKFDSGMVLSGELPDFLNIYLKAQSGDSDSIREDMIRQVRVDILKRNLHGLSSTEFQHTKEDSDFILNQVIFAGCNRVSDTMCTYYWK